MTEYQDLLTLFDAGGSYSPRWRLSSSLYGEKISEDEYELTNQVILSEQGLVVRIHIRTTRLLDYWLSATGARLGHALA